MWPMSVIKYCTNKQMDACILWSKRRRVHKRGCSTQAQTSTDRFVSSVTVALIVMHDALFIFSAHYHISIKCLSAMGRLSLLILLLNIFVCNWKSVGVIVSMMMSCEDATRLAYIRISYDGTSSIVGKLVGSKCCELTSTSADKISWQILMLFFILFLLSFQQFGLHISFL